MALRRKELHRLDRRGRPIGKPVPLLGTNEHISGNVSVQAGPADLEVSPNGKLAAYWIGTLYNFCNPVTFVCEVRLQDNVAVTRTNRFTGVERFRLVRDYEEPAWLGIPCWSRCRRGARPRGGRRLDPPRRPREAGRPGRRAGGDHVGHRTAAHGL